MEKITSLIRHLLGIGAGYLIGSGILDVAQAEAIIAGIMVVIPIIWGQLAKSDKFPAIK